MRIAIGSDDYYHIAEFLVEELRRRGYELILIGALATGKPYPWPRVGFEVGEIVSSGRADMGIVICYTGTGVSIAANKVKGIRAALCFDSQTARGARLWNNANILALSARLLSEEVAKEILDAWLSIESPDPSEEENIRELQKIEVIR